MPNLNIKENISLFPFTAFKIGGPAKFFIEVKTKDELVEAINWSKENKTKFFLLAGGSNVLISDKGFDGLIIKIVNGDVKVRGTRIESSAGAPLAKAASSAISQNLSGFEWSVGIPRATIGGAIAGNAEAFNVSMSDIVETVEVFDALKLKFKTLSNRDCGFGYRASVFKKNKNYIIWSAIFKLIKKQPDIIQGLVSQSIEFRKNNYPKLPSAGSVFKNVPIKIIKENNPELLKRIRERGITRLDNVGAGMLIDTLGLKGKTIGGAKISLEHANHIVNTGKATADDVIMLISYIKQQARDKIGIQLMEEIQIIEY